MRRALLCVILLGVFAFGCELNESECELPSKYGNIVVSFEPRPIKPMTETTLKIKGLKGAKAPKIHIYGLSMYMGHLREDLDERGGELEAQIMIAPCDEVKMVFSLEILDGDEIIAQTDFTTFQ